MSMFTRWPTDRALAIGRADKRPTANAAAGTQTPFHAWGGRGGPWGVPSQGVRQLLHAKPASPARSRCKAEAEGRGA